MPFREIRREIAKKNTELRNRIRAELDCYIAVNYVEETQQDTPSAEYCQAMPMPEPMVSSAKAAEPKVQQPKKTAFTDRKPAFRTMKKSANRNDIFFRQQFTDFIKADTEEDFCAEEVPEDFEEAHLPALEERMCHLSDTFSEYLIYLIASKGMTNAQVYKDALVDKKVFSKIKNNPEYHPQKITALCLCMGAKLNLDETKDLLARAGYALSPCEKTDIIFSYFIEHEIYDMYELDIQLEEHGLPCIIA